MQKSLNFTLQRLKRLGIIAFVLFFISFIFSHDATNAAIWAVFLSYLCIGILLNEKKIIKLSKINLPISLTILIISIINIYLDVFTMPSYFSNIEALSASITLFLLASIGITILPSRCME